MTMHHVPCVSTQASVYDRAAEASDALSDMRDEYETIFGLAADLRKEAERLHIDGFTHPQSGPTLAADYMHDLFGDMLPDGIEAPSRAIEAGAAS